ncbi:flagellar hook-basal body protein [uncultured Sphingomonas sp.]|uniref:flagellar hook-basal body protein n=1 Tax=uncultured Sphingomonas sp. TaxID=158754 RepID=UPI0035CA2989
MSGLIDTATMIMRASSQRIDVAAINVANVSTSGFKRQLRGADAMASATAPFDAALARVRVDLAAGKLMDTGRPLDLAINGDGYFQLRAGDRLVYSRQGGFALAADGRVLTPQGYALQQVGGGDLVLDTATFKVAGDGTVLDGDRALGRITVMRAREGSDAEAIDGALFAIRDDAVEDVAAPSLRQGALEASNVLLGDEMISMMGALRGAETGARLVQVYDDLMGKAISTFGQVGR